MSGSTAEISYSIAELASEFDVSYRTLRFYEEKRLLMPERVGTQRVYSLDDRRQLSWIVNLRARGIALADIGRLHGLMKAGASPLVLCQTSKSIFERRLAYLQKRRGLIEDQIKELQELARSPFRRGGLIKQI